MIGLEDKIDQMEDVFEDFEGAADSYRRALAVATQEQEQEERRKCRKEGLLSVPDFSFGWQSSYRLVTPYAMEKGDKLHCIAHFDNSSANPNNPNPGAFVIWGDQTWNEMMLGYFDYYHADG